MISIIVPVYKAEKYIHRCIDSILAQSHTDFELLLIDDGSPDNCGAMCDEYAAQDGRVRVFHKENGGVSSARNLGLDNAQGEYITFCDADDYVSEDWLAAYSGAIANNVDLAIQGYYAIDGNNTVEKQLQPHSGNSIEAKRQLITSLMSQGMYGYLWVKLFRRAIIEEHAIRFDSQSTFREDEQFFSRCLEYTSSFIYTDRVGYYYIVPPASKSYRGDPYYSIFPIFQSLDKVFDRNLPKKICQIHYVNVKDGAVKYLAEGQRLTDYHIDLYQRIVCTLGYTKGIKNKLLNTLILKSHQLGVISIWMVRVIRKILS